MTTEERLEKFERMLLAANRPNHWLLVVLVLCLAALIVIGAFGCKRAAVQPVSSIAGEVRATRFVLVDDKGEHRAWLVMDVYGPAMTLFDQEGEPLAQLAVGKGASWLCLMNDKTKQRVQLSVHTPEDNQEGSFAVTPALTLVDENGTSRAHFGLTLSGPDLWLGNENGEQRVGLSAFKDGAVLNLHSENDKGGLGLVTGKEVGGKYRSGLVLRDEKGTPRAQLISNEDGPGLTLADEEGKAMWKAPQLP
ncbi:MAG TPA: hypothetical protein VLI39_21730 [Sedimentisphaerales bacterium]|nr:hypothetical protein [Sedimentisphaerales bacterium]